MNEKNTKQTNFERSIWLEWKVEVVSWLGAFRSLDHPDSNCLNKNV